MHQLCQHIFSAYLVLIATVNVSRGEGPLPEIVYHNDGDVVLGGLFGLHYTTKYAEACLITRELPALKRVEAMVYAIDHINADDTILPGISIGFDIYDTCYYDIVSLGRSMNFVPDTSGEVCACSNHTETGGSGGICCDTVPLVGIVGAERSECSIQSATLMGLHHTPVISYLSTSDTLSNKNVYPSFLRTVPPDRYQVSVIVDILRRFNWTYVSFLYSDDEYGQNAYAEFTTQSQEAGICIAYHESLDESADQSVYDHVYSELLQYPYNRAKAVVLFTHPQHTAKMMRASLNGTAPGLFTWVGSDGVGTIGPQGFQDLGLMQAALGMLTTVPFSKSLPDFDDAFSAINPSSSNNPWVDEFYDDCGSDSVCANRASDILFSSHETLVMDAVYAYAHAIDDLMNAECSGNVTDAQTKQCVVERSTSGNGLLPYLRAVSFQSLANGNFSFNEDGDGEGKYAIENYRLDADGNFEAASVGFWQQSGMSSQHLILNETAIRFYTDVGWDTAKPPASICSEECPTGQAKFIADTAICCWDCIQCELNEIVVNQTACEPCPADALPDSATDYLTCLSVDTVPLIFHGWLGPTLVGVSGVGFIATCVVLVLYITHFKNPMLKYSDPLLHSFILFGIFLCHAFSVTAVLKPSEALCSFTRMAGSLTYTFIYVPLAIRCVRLYRIFKKAKATDSQEEAHLLLKVSGQLVFISVAVLLQAGMETAWLVLYPSTISPFPYEEDGELRIQMACAVWWLEPVSSVIFNLPFLFLCCIFSILARHLPDNYHESRFITFSAFGSCILIAAFSLPYVAANLEFESTLYSALLASINAMLVLVCIFVIKLYAVISVSPEVPLRVASAIAPRIGGMNNGAERARARTRTRSGGGGSRTNSSAANAVTRRPQARQSDTREVTFSDISKEQGEVVTNDKTENTRL